MCWKSGRESVSNKHLTVWDLLLTNLIIMLLMISVLYLLLPIYVSPVKLTVSLVSLTRNNNCIWWFVTKNSYRIENQAELHFELSSHCTLVRYYTFFSFQLLSTRKVPALCKECNIIYYSIFVNAKVINTLKSSNQ